MINPFQTVWDLNQWQKNYAYRCSIFSFAHNIYYNTWIWLSYQDIDELWKRAKAKWWLDDKKWWKTEIFELCYDYIQELKKTPWNKLFNTLPEIKLVKTYANMQEYKDLLANNYVARIGIWVNKSFLDDIRVDWIINQTDYAKFQWKYMGHFINMWTKKSDWNTKNIIIDNYFWKISHPVIEWVNFKEMEKIMQNTIYAVLPTKIS